MPKISIVAGATSQTVNIFIADSTSTTGAGLTGLVFNTAGLTAYYMLPRAAAVAITLATLAAVTSAYSSGGFKEIDATHAPGWYRLDLPNAAIASGRFSSMHLQGATNMAPLPVEIELTGWDNQDAAAGGLTSVAAIKVQTDKLTFTVANQVDSNVLDWKSATAPAMTGDAFARLGAPAGASVSADVAAVKVDTAAIKVQTDKLTFTVANQVDSNVLDWKSSTAPAMTGDAFARLGAPAGASVSADVAAVKSDTNSIGTIVTALPTATANADALLKRDMSVVTGEAARSPLNALRALRNKTSIGAGILTVTKEDDTTSAWTGVVTTDVAALPITAIDPA
jgi:hypothetical protein